MKFKTLGVILCLLAVMFFSSCLARQEARFRDQGPPTDPALVQGVLPNGFQYWIMKNATPRDRVNVHLNVFVGSVHETEEEQGAAHFLEHMLFNGSEHFKPGELITYFQSIGMDFGADANASTSFFNTVYDLTLPKGDRRFLTDAFRVIQDYAGGALLLEDEINRERGIILAEKRERDTISFRSFKKELAFELPGSLLNQRFPIGTTPVLETADQKLLKAFYDRWYRPDNMALVVVGDLDLKETQDLIKQSFSRLASRTPAFSAPDKPVDISWTPHSSLSSFYHYEPEAGATEITIERVSHEPFEVQTLEKLKEIALKNLGYEIFQNRLTTMINQQTAHFSSASTYSGHFLHHVSLAAVKASCQPDKWEKTLVQLEKTLRQALEFGFSKEELDRVKADFISKLDSDVAMADTRTTDLLAQSILGAMDEKKLFLSPLQRQKILKPYLQELTLADVNQVFKYSWADQNRLVLVSGNAKISPVQDLSPDQQILALYQASAGQPIQVFEGFESKAFPYLVPAEPKAPILKKTDNVQNLGITQVEFQNNIRLNLKQTAYKKGEFLFKVVFGQGRASEPEALVGLSDLVASAIQQSGFQSMDLDQMEEALAGKQVGMEFTIQDNYFALTGSGDPEQAETIFQLIYTQLKDPGFRSRGLSLAKTHYRQMYDARKRTPDGIMAIQGQKFLAKGDPRFGLCPPDTIDTLTLDPIEAWLRPIFETAALEVSIVGDFDPDTIIGLAHTYLGALGQRDRPLLPDRMATPVFFPKGEKLVLSLDTKLDKGMVRVGFLTDDFWNIHQTRKLSLLARVFAERLRKTIREEFGESYSPYAYNDPSLVHDGYGVFHVVVNVLPETSDRVYGQIENMVKDLVTGGISENELDLVKKPLLNQLEVFRQTNAYWLNSVLADSIRYPEKLDWAGNMEADFLAITHDDLAGLARRYLKMVESALILIQPRSESIQPMNEKKQVNQ